MKYSQILLSFIVSSLWIPLSFAAPVAPAGSDFYYVADTQGCMIIKYTCGKGWDYYGDNTGCGCQRILSEKLMKHLDSTMNTFFERIEEKGYSDEEILSLLDRLIFRLQELGTHEKYATMVGYVLSLIETYQQSL